MRIEVRENRVEGFCNIPGWRGEQSVIAFNTIHGKWHCASSMCLPSDIKSARAVQECVSMAFSVLADLEE